ncbi:MAG: RNA-binding cell elongation regulator Jag/EloR [Anaerolineales bacterium]|jgi:spoIIIJ-associated protein
MSETSGQTTLEIIAPSVEEAIEKGLSQLNLPEEAVTVEVLDRGNKGLFGLGSRDARVRLIVTQGSPTPDMEPAKQAAQRVPEQAEPQLEDQYEDEEFDEGESDFGEYDEEEIEDTFEEDFEYDESDEAELTAEQERSVKIARSTVADLLERMNVPAQVEAVFHPAQDEDDRPTIWVNITGKDLSVLIGRRSQTLNALQYITALIVGKELGRSVPLVIDVEGYRSRREAQLRRLATTMADQAVKTGRIQALEPMPANERRIVHIAVRNYPGVTTKSIGEDPHRKVTIIPDEQD